jgi:putative ABC transport system substrate-binding protein
MAVVPDPVALGFVKSLSHPGGNITGPSASIYIGGYLGGLTAKRMQLIKELIPAVRVLGILWNEGALSNTIVFKSANETASSFALSIKSFSLRNPADLNETLSNLSKEHPDAVLVLGDPLFFDRRKDIIRFSIEHQIPTFHVWPEEAVDGAFAAYGSRLSDDYGRAAHYVDRILKGAMPNDLPVEQPTKFDLVINVKTAKALGLTIPESFLLRADEVIE